jgi:hypothetical protein
MLLAFRVDGKARPKGSFTPVPKRRSNGSLYVWMKPSSPDCDLWARHVTAVARQALALVGGTVGDVTGFPTVLPVRVRTWFGFERPARTTVEGNEYAPVSEYFGDWDKLLRNVLDALKTAGVYADDRLVVGPIGDCGKSYVADGDVAHTIVEVWEDW